MISHEQAAVRRQNVIAVVLVGSAILLGGGGSPAPFPELALQLISAILLAAWAMISPHPVPRAVPTAWLLAALLVALPVIHLIPLPPALWHALPGRSLERAALALVGAEDTWRPWSLAPARTLASLIALVTPAIVLVMTASLSRSGRSMVMGMIAGAALLALLVGTAQMAGGEANAVRFYVPDVGYLNGFQANHNSAADVLLIGMIAFAAVVRDWSERRRPTDRPGYRLGLVAGATLLFSLGVVLTASRAGTALLPIAIAGVLAIVWPWLHFSRKALMGIGVLCLVAVGGALYLSQHNGVIAQVLGRYNFEGEFRPQLWTDAVYAAQQYFPFGAGVGTFIPVFIAVERLEVVDTTLPNRAHNDGLEFLIEGGVFSIVILSVIAAILVRKLLQGLKNPPCDSRGQVYFAVAAFCIIALHSQVDYPLRSMSLACIAASAAGLLMPLRGKSAIA